MNRSKSELDLSDLKKSAIVFAPHQDDETLGCGGTILSKKKVGASIKVVFMTDGCRSHTRLISENELRLIRSKEAIEACRVLGVDESDVISLNFEDGRLNDNQELAVHKVAEILLAYQPEQVFIPYHKEGHLDHSLTNSIVLSALKMQKNNVTVYEYPVWFWFHWPWVGFPSRRWEIKPVLKNTLSARFGLKLLRDFRSSNSIAAVLDLKRTALNQHRTQMTRFVPDPAWMTLEDVSKGDFLACLLQEREFFYSYQINNQNTASRDLLQVLPESPVHR